MSEFEPLGEDHFWRNIGLGVVYLIIIVAALASGAASMMLILEVVK